jgi:hypothetical protein
MVDLGMDTVGKVEMLSLPGIKLRYVGHAGCMVRLKTVFGCNTGWQLSSMIWE